ncbi:hypothetical protein P261_01068 [Lachnospiraceae bacterium TWA4]|nr:hypothetical protein P261_01068 [Lachnospiraceae bacterium TWA4]
MAEKNKKLIAAGIAGGAVVVLGIAYGVGAWQFSDKFQLNTKINGINVQGKTVEEVKSLLDDSIADYKLTIKQRNDVSETIVGKDIDLAITHDDAVQTLLDSQNPYQWPLALFSNNDSNVDLKIEYDTKKLASIEDNLDLFNKDKIIKPVNAHISDYSSSGFSVVKEVMGTTIDTDKTKASIDDCLTSLTSELTIEEAKLYKDPTIYSDNEQLNSLCDEVNKYSKLEITYTYGSEKETLTGDTIATWLKIDDSKSFKVSVDEDKAAEYISSLARKHDTIFRKHTFKTHSGRTITINKGDYGWWTNKTQTTEDLVKAITNFESGNREVIYKQTAASFDGNDYGNTYAEVDLGSQTLYYYKNGKLQMTSSFVSGNVSTGHATPSGIYSVTYKKPGQRMVGADYDVMTSYWMPFNGDIGFHDASWRSSFGGSLYKTRGSHGCVNMPVSRAKKLYSLISKGDAVICYY